MRIFIFGFTLLMFALVTVISIAATKVESGSLTALSYVLYGKKADGTLVPLAVDTDGKLYAH
jgi:hypothetical protein